MKIKEFFVIILFIIGLLIVYGLFPVRNVFQQVVVMATFFGIIPIVFNRFILKKELSEIGIKVGDWKKGLLWSGISIIIIGLGFLIIIYFFNFLKHYTIPSLIIHDYKNFLFYEFLSVLPAVFLYDFFFRGFIMLTLEKRLLYWAIVAQALLFLILVLATGSPIWTLVPYLISAPLAGLIVYKSRSIFYSTALQFIVILLLDANIVRLIK